MADALPTWLRDDQAWEWRDLSPPLGPSAPLWPDSPGIRLEWRLTLAGGDGCNASTLHMDPHAGAHVDAPLHHLPHGRDAAALHPALFCGPAWVARVHGVDRIGPAQLEAALLPGACRRLLLRTDNSSRRRPTSPDFHSDYAALSEEGARWLVMRGVRLVGVDGLSVQPWRGDDRVHAILLEHGLGVLEGLCLDDVPSGWWELLAAPLPLCGAEGSPVRALLRRPAKDAAPSKAPA